MFGISESDRVIKGPTGTFGQIYFYEQNKSLSKKTPINKTNQKCKLLQRELSIYYKVYECIVRLELENIKTIRAKSDPDDDSSFIAQRIYPPNNYTKLIQIDYSEQEDMPAISVYTPRYIIEHSLLNSTVVNINIPFELGCLWIIMIIKFKKVLWEPELFISRLYGEKHNSLFILDFDKVIDVSHDDMLYTTTSVPIYNYLTNIFPNPKTDYFIPFSNGIIKTCSRFDKEYIGRFVIDGILKLSDK